VLCAASADAAPANRTNQLDFLESLSCGIAGLVTKRVTGPVLRIALQLYEITLPGGHSLYALLIEMSKSPASRDAAVFVMRLAQKSPMEFVLQEEAKDRYYRCEVIEPLAGDDAA